MEMAALLGWSVPTLNAALVKDPEFPVVARGSKGVAWEFDVAAVFAHWRKLYAPPVETQGALPLGDAGNPVARAKEAQAQLLEAKVAALTRDTIERSEVVAVWSGAYRVLGKKLEQFPRQLARRLMLTPEQVETVRELCDEMRNDFVDRSGEYIDTVDKPKKRRRKSHGHARA
jgi:hypothetical protein